MAEKKYINWINLTTEEIKIKKLEMENNYEALKNLAVDILAELDNINNEYDRANKELSKREF